jgi:LPS-assembly protein
VGGGPSSLMDKSDRTEMPDFNKITEGIKPTDEELKSRETATPIVVNGDKVQYDYANMIVSGEGNVSITYKEIKLTCDKIVVNIDAKEGVAEGNVRLFQEGNVFSADNVIYNFATKKGELLNGAMKMPPWYGKSELIDKVDDKIYKLNRSYVTTCDLEAPHYRVTARTIKVYLNDRVTAWHAFFYLGNIPVTYVPYYNHPLKDNLPQVDIVPGYDKDWGVYALTAWRYFFHPDSKGHVHLDYRSKRGLGEGADYSYKMGKFGDGYARFYFIHDREPPDADKKDRWRIQARHKWKVDQYSVMTGEYHKLSDKDIIKDFFYKQEFELDQQPPTYLSYIGAKDEYSFEILAEKRINRFFTVTEKLPEAKMNIRKLKLFNFINLYYQSNSDVAIFKRDIADDVAGASPNDDYDAARVDSYNELSYPFRLFGFLSINPFVGLRETYYSKGPQSQRDILRNMFNCGAELYARFFKIYDIETNLFGLDIHDIRHLVMPSARYEYITNPNYNPNGLLQFDSIDSLQRDNGVKLTLENKLQTKRTGKNGQKETVDLAMFLVDTKYVIKGPDEKKSRLQDIKCNLEIKPYDWMFIKSEAVIEPAEHRIKTANADFYLDKREDLDLGLGYRYERGESHNTSQLTSQLTYRINKNWKFRIYERFDMRVEKFQQQEYTIYRDLHCWIGEVTCRIEEEKDFTFWVIFRLKAFPDIPFLFRTTYHGPEPGSGMKH